MNTLYQHQKDFLTLNPDKTALVWSCGTGKTRTAIEWAMMPIFDVAPIFIICPKSLKTNWEREVKKWFKKSFVEARLAILIFTKEEFRRDWQKLPKANQVIVDEVHNGFLTPGFKSQMSKALRKYLKMHKVPRVLLLSATVYTSSPWNIYNLAYYTGHQWNYLNFKHKFFYDIPMGMRTISVPKPNIQGQLVELMRKITSIVDIKDCMDVPLQQHLDPEYFALTKEQEKAIKDSYDPVPIVRFTKQHEIENGILIGNEFEKDKVFDCDKNERILNLVKENKKIAIVCRYNAQIENLRGLLEAYNPMIISGKVENRDKICLDAEKAESAVVIIQADCGIGFELPSFEVCIFASMSYSYTSHEQMCGRFLRMNKPSRTTFFYLLTEGDSIDQAVFDAISKKKDFQIELYEKNY